MVNQERNKQMKTNEQTTKIGVGCYSIELNEAIMRRMEMMKDCGYMIDDLQKIITKIVELYQGEWDFGEIISAEDSMRMIATLHEAKKDYAFLTSLNVQKDTVLASAISGQ